MSLIKSVTFVVVATASAVSAAQWGGPEMYRDCTSCTNAGQTWQEEARACTYKCAIPDISCVRSSSRCPGSYPPPPPPQRPFDCYVDVTKVRGYRYEYINMWKRAPCSGQSLGALYDGRGLYYATPSSPFNDWPANCGSGNFDYIEMQTASGKSVGWVASEFLNCGRYPPPAAPRPPPAAASVALPSPPSTAADDSMA